jgi:hypothetical protein
MLHCVTGQVVLTILKDNSGCLTLKMWTLHISEKSEATHPATQHNIPEDFDLQLHHCENPKSCISDLLVSFLFQAPDQCNGFTAVSIPAKSHPLPHPVVTTVSQSLPAERNVNNREGNIWTVDPTSDHSPAEPKQLWVAPSFGQPTPAPDSQSCGDPVEHLRLSHSSYSIQDSDNDTSAMISDNLALRYA